MHSNSKNAVSNLAWSTACDDAALAFARSLGFTGIEISPFKTFGGWPDDLLSRADSYRRKLADLGLSIPAIQAITFGVEGVRLFGDASQQARLTAHLRLVARLAGALGAGACVFGAPKVRDLDGLSYQAAFESSALVFRELAPYFVAQDSTLAFEPNPAAYGCNFITTTAEAIDLVEAVSHAGFRLQIDAGTVLLNKESSAMIARASGLASHMHVSEPMLEPVGKYDHSRIAHELRVSGYNHWRSIEMRENPDWHQALVGGAELLSEQYR